MTCKPRNHRLLGLSEALQGRLLQKRYSSRSPQEVLKTHRFLSLTLNKALIQESWIGPGNLPFSKPPPVPKPSDPEAPPGLGFCSTDKSCLDMDSLCWGTPEVKELLTSQGRLSLPRRIWALEILFCVQALCFFANSLHSFNLVLWLH